jgi:hypothetical protein
VAGQVEHWPALRAGQPGGAAVHSAGPGPVRWRRRPRSGRTFRHLELEIFVGQTLQIEAEYRGGPSAFGVRRLALRARPAGAVRLVNVDVAARLVTFETVED